MIYRRFHFFYRFYSAYKIHRELSMTKKQPFVKLKVPSFFGKIVLGISAVKCVSQTEESQIEVPSPVYVKTRLEESCLHSVAEILSLVEEVSLAVTNCSFQYKNNLSELITSYEKYKSVEEYSVLREECEQVLIAVRAKVRDSKKEFLDLITIFESVHKVASAVSELSFLVASESSALKLYEVVDSLQRQVKEELEEIKKLENKCLSVEKNMIASTKY